MLSAQCQLEVGEGLWSLPVGRRLPMQVRLDDFWTTLLRRFPSLVSVVFSDKMLQYHETPLPHELVRIAEACPEGILVSVSSLHRYNRVQPQPMTRCLWQKEHNRAWVLVDTTWIPRSILAPNKNYRGPVGGFLRLENERINHLNYLQNALETLAVQATEAYYLHTLQKPCICPSARCEQSFEKPGEWATHFTLCSALHDFDAAIDGLPLPLCEKPCAAFKRHDARLGDIQQQIEAKLAKMRSEWGQDGSEARENVTQRSLQQLRDDPMYAVERASKGSVVWQRYEQDMIDEDDF